MIRTMLMACLILGTFAPLVHASGPEPICVTGGPAVFTLLSLKAEGSADACAEGTDGSTYDVQACLAETTLVLPNGGVVANCADGQGANGLSDGDTGKDCSHHGWSTVCCEWDANGHWNCWEIWGGEQPLP